MSEVVLIRADSLPEELRARWWTPSADALAAIVPGVHVKVLAAEPEELWSKGAVWVAVEERDEDGFAGTIVASHIHRDGFRAGDRFAAPLDRIFDWVSFDEWGRPRLNEDRARLAIGRRVLVGLTVLSDAGDPIEHLQFAGTLREVDPDRALVLELDEGGVYLLPPDVRALEEAAPGEYRLESTGEIVVDPDYVATWTSRKKASPG